jgi:hypothetical protein
MNEFTTWVQSNWYELGNLLAEFVFLGVGIWFARKQPVLAYAVGSASC